MAGIFVVGCCQGAFLIKMHGDHYEEWKRKRLRATAHSLLYFFLFQLISFCTSLYTLDIPFLFDSHIFSTTFFLLFWSWNVNIVDFVQFFLPFISSNTYCNFVFLLFSNDFNSLPVPVFYLWVPFFTIQTTNYRQISIGLDSHIQLHHNVVLLL